MTTTEDFYAVRKDGIALLLDFTSAKWETWRSRMEEVWPSLTPRQRRAARSLLSMINRLYADLLDFDEPRLRTQEPGSPA